MLWAARQFSVFVFNGFLRRVWYCCCFLSFKWWKIKIPVPTSLARQYNYHFFWVIHLCVHTFSIHTHTHTHTVFDRLIIDIMFRFYSFPPKFFLSFVQYFLLSSLVTYARIWQNHLLMLVSVITHTQYVHVCVSMCDWSTICNHDLRKLYRAILFFFKKNYQRTYFPHTYVELIAMQKAIHTLKHRA